MRYVAGVHPEVRWEAKRRDGWESTRTSAMKQLIVFRAANVAEEIASLPAPKNQSKIYQDLHQQNTQSHPI